MALDLGQKTFDWGVLSVVELLFLRLLLGVQNHPETMDFYRSV